MAQLESISPADLTVTKVVKETAAVEAGALSKVHEEQWGANGPGGQGGGGRMIKGANDEPKHVTLSNPYEVAGSAAGTVSAGGLESGAAAVAAQGLASATGGESGAGVAKGGGRGDRGVAVQDGGGGIAAQDGGYGDGTKKGNYLDLMKKE